MGVATGVAVAGLAIGVTTSIVQMNQAKKAQGDAETRRKDLEGDMQDLENSRQKLTNPYESLTNQYANLSVATKAAEMQIEETDKALANTLDMLRVSGGSAGGATALAQAAMKSKQGVAASIETQEVQNEKLRAQGQMQVDQMKAQGGFQMMGMQETREMQGLDRMQGLIDQERVMESEANQAYWGAFGNMGTSVSSGMGNTMTGMSMSGDSSNPGWY